MNFTELNIVSVDIAKTNKFQNKTIVITGSFKTILVIPCKAKLESMGAKVSSSVSKKN